MFFCENTWLCVFFWCLELTVHGVLCLVRCIVLYVVLEYTFRYYKPVIRSNMIL